jgi:hypothetical protein
MYRLLPCGGEGESQPPSTGGAMRQGLDHVRESEEHAIEVPRDLDVAAPAM